MTTLLLKLYAIVLSLLALAYIIPGAILMAEGGSLYYLVAGLALLASGVLLFLKRSAGLLVYSLFLFGTLIWALFEQGMDFWPLVPRLALITLLGLLLLLPVFRRPLNGSGGLLTQPLTWSLAVVLGVTLMAYISYLGSLSISPDEFAGRERRAGSQVAAGNDWVAYGGPREGTRYVPAEQITPDNVDQLEVAWVQRTKVGATFKNTPLQVNDTLYACAGGNIIIAMNAETGDELWRFDAEISEELKQGLTYFTTTCRAVSYYEAPADYSGECPRRILMGTTDARLMAVDADTGEQCRNFGDNGEVDLSRKLGEVKTGFYFVTSAPAIVAGNAVVSGWVRDNYEVKEPSGAIRAFDAITGDFAWAWDMGRPGDNGEPGPGEVYTRGIPNVWSTFAVDSERDMVFAPLGNETPDYFAGDGRHEASEKYASSIVALNGSTGELIWHFQTVHHDIWDYDVPSQPALVDVPDENGILVPAVVQATKRGEVFMLNRLTGDPIAPVEEKPTPQEGAVPEEWLAPTQPFSSLPNVLDHYFTDKDMWGITPFDQLWCRINFQRMDYEGHFTPPSTRGTYQFPGNSGGYNWGSVSVHEDQQIMVGNVMSLGNRLRLVTREEIEAGVRASPQLGTPYGSSTRTFVSPLGIPCNQPPFGMIAAIDLQNQDLLWKRPVGTSNDLGPWGIKVRIPMQVGTPNSGGTMVTKSGLIFFGGTMDRYFRAFDLYTGEELWHYKLPESAQATPMSYVNESGEQMIILTLPAQGREYGGSRSPGEEDSLGGYVMAFKLKAE